MSDVSVITFGCRLNSYESEVMRTHAQTAGLDQCVIINSCAVTAEAERQLRQAIRKARRETPAITIIVTGCAAQIKPDHYAAMAEVDFVVGNDLKMMPQTYQTLKDRINANLRDDKILVSDIQKIKDTALHLVKGFEGRTRAFVQVQNGCDNHCTFCIVPQGRGRSRSVLPDEVVAQVRMLVQEGYPEIALTGVDITSYGNDLATPLTLGALIKHILKEVPALEWLRLSSLDPAAIDEDMWDLLAHEKRLLSYLHLSMQAGDDMILKRMARRHRRQDLIDLCARARSLRPAMVFGADLIAGFPTETDAMFENTRSLVQELGITWLHVFPYSAREGTAAAKMPPVPVTERRRRAAALREVGQGAVNNYLDSLNGQVLTLHVEKPTLGRTEGFAEALWDENQPQEVGTLIKAKVTGYHKGQLLVEKVDA